VRTAAASRTPYHSPRLSCVACSAAATALWRCHNAWSPRPHRASARRCFMVIKQMMETISRCQISTWRSDTLGSNIMHIVKDTSNASILLRRIASGDNVADLLMKIPPLNAILAFCLKYHISVRGLINLAFQYIACFPSQMCKQLPTLPISEQEKFAESISSSPTCLTTRLRTFSMLSVLCVGICSSISSVS